MRAKCPAIPPYWNRLITTTPQRRNNEHRITAHDFTDNTSQFYQKTRHNAFHYLHVDAADACRSVFLLLWRKVYAKEANGGRRKPPNMAFTQVPLFIYFPHFSSRNSLTGSLSWMRVLLSEANSFEFDIMVE